MNEVMTRSLQNWATVCGIVFSLAAAAFSAKASSDFSGDLMTGAPATASLFGSNDKVCVISRNTGSALWYNPRNHGFVEMNLDRQAPGFASPEELIFGASHAIALDEMEAASVFNPDLQSSPIQQMTAEATVGIGSSTGLVFHEDGQIYVIAPVSSERITLKDPTGILTKMAMSEARWNRGLVKVLGQNLAVVPEPSSFALVAAGAALLGARSRRRR
jgi:hypothetical protein